MAHRVPELRQVIADWLPYVQLVDVATVQVAAQRHAESLPDDVTVRLECKPSRVDRGDDRVLMWYKHRATFFPTAAADPDSDPTVSDSAPLGRVETCHFVTFTTKGAPAIDDESLRAFAEADAYFVAYPYVREALQHLATQVGLPPLVLPMLPRDLADDATTGG